MQLDDEVVSNFVVAKVFSESTDQINSMDFSSDGLTLLASSNDESIFVYDCRSAELYHQVNSKKYGVDLIRFTREENTALHASTKIDESIRYLSLPDSQYIRYFPGHTKKVIALCMSPRDTSFLSSSLDGTVRLWDLHSQNCVAMMEQPGESVLSFEPEGLIFAVGVSSESIKMYDIRSVEKGPFDEFILSQVDSGSSWTGLKFSPDGKHILISTNGQYLYVVDAFEGQRLHSLTGYANENSVPLEASFSGDSNYVFSGSTDGQIHAWSADSGKHICALPSEHNGCVPRVQFNPKHVMIATASSTMAFWIPGDDDATSSVVEDTPSENGDISYQNGAAPVGNGDVPCENDDPPYDIDDIP